MLKQKERYHNVSVFHCVSSTEVLIMLIVSVLSCAELLSGRELVEKDLRAVQLNALEQECKRAAHIALSHYNQAQVLSHH